MRLALLPAMHKLPALSLVQGPARATTKTVFLPAALDQTAIHDPPTDAKDPLVQLHVGFANRLRRVATSPEPHFLREDSTPRNV